jgi:hypothetical protein
MQSQAKETIVGPWVFAEGRNQLVTCRQNRFNATWRTRDVPQFA